MSNSTIPLQQVVNFCSTHADLLPLAGVGGYTDEPALSLCNDALSDLISTPNDWWFNRQEMPVMFTCPNRQDQLFAGACMFSYNVSPGIDSQTAAPSLGWNIDLATNSAIQCVGNTVTVNFIESGHRFIVGQTVYMTGNTNANYNSVFADNGLVSGWSNGWVITATTPTSVSFTATAGMNDGDITGAPGINDLGYLTSASMVELNNTSSPPNVYPLTARRELAVISRVATPEKVAVMTDLGTGVIKIRFSFIPGTTVFGANLVYQRKAPLKTSLTQFWDPFPDNFQACYRQALLYRMYRYLNSPTTQAEYQKLQAEIAKTQGADDAASTDVNLQPEEGLLDTSINGWGWGY
jgi:hypothetical protein